MANNYFRIKLTNTFLNRFIFNSKYSTDTKAFSELKIPNRIERGPTDILRALESTISRDPTAGHYKYQDDPYLIPKSNLGKRAFALAQEAGRKSAYWIRQEHPDLFQHKVAEPPIKKFIPQIVVDEDLQVTEDALKELIDDHRVSDSIKVYELLEKNGHEFSNEFLQEYLEFLCFYNCEDQLPEEWIEEKWFTESLSPKKLKKTWRDGDLAEKIFRKISPPTEKTYSTLIQGMLKHYEVDKAWQLYEQAQNENKKLTLETYNLLIKCASFLRESNDLRWQLIIDLLKSIKNQNLKPNISTLNSVMHALNGLAQSRNLKDYIKSTLIEFKKIGIEPSLATWYYVIQILCFKKNQKSGVLYDIMDVIDKKEFKIQDINDTFFFVTSMEVCRYHLQDVDLAKRIDSLLHYKNNYDLIGDSYKESVYYRNYFALKCIMDPLSEFMEFYNHLVPNIYIPEPGVMQEVLKTIDINGAIEYMPKIYSDMCIFDHVDRENLLTMTLDIIGKYQPPFEEPKKEVTSDEKSIKIESSEELESTSLNDKLKYIAWDIFERIKNQPEDKLNKINYHGTMLNNILSVLVHNKEFEKSVDVVTKLNENKNNIVGIVSPNILKDFIRLCIENKQPSKTVMAIEYCENMDFVETKDLVKYLYDSITLNEDILNKLTKIVGTEVFEQIEQNKKLN